MKIQLASDLHLERFGDRFVGRRALRPTPGAQLLVLAGDIGSADLALAEFAEWPVPVVAVGGNHEAYGSSVERVSEAARLRAQALGIHFLDCDAVQFGQVRVLGCTLWTDYQLYGNPLVARKFAAALLADHSFIERSDGAVFQPEDAEALHKRQRRWLQEQLEQPFDGKTVVVTHHGPHPDGVAAEFKNSPYNPAFFSDLRHLMPMVDLWVHGHTHASVNLREGRCRVVCNPRGYPLNIGQANNWGDLRFENKTFNPKLTVDV